jgi:hypothetical protein
MYDMVGGVLSSFELNGWVMYYDCIYRSRQNLTKCTHIFRSPNLANSSNSTSACFKSCDGHCIAHSRLVSSQLCNSPLSKSIFVAHRKSHNEISLIPKENLRISYEFNMSLNSMLSNSL